MFFFARGGRPTPPQVQAVWCEGITDATLLTLSRVCAHLEAVHIAFCEGVSAAAAAALRATGVEVVILPP